jgi:2-C-methyl-D-erythritol 4-phosphate cytidylyltransferase / 2-C-methyl-D-erythritol 2,4-cyclodiphosphate synthase
VSSRSRTAALIVAAGRGERMGGGVPKQFAALGGKPVVAHAIAAFQAHPDVDEVLVVIGAGQEPLLPPGVRHVIGGEARRDSVRAGLAALDCERVLIHDAARPLLPATVIDRLLAALETAPGAVPVLPVADTLAHGDALLGDVVPRGGLVRVQTPQSFHYGTIVAAHEQWDATQEATDDAQVARAAGHQVVTVEGDSALEKLTYPQDVAAAEARLASRLVSRSATGYDVHRLEAGEELWLGGVLVPHDRGLSGHSDADVALHAITDALLGTIGAGDIGTHFPPSDPQWRGAASDQFLAHAASLVRADGGIIDFVDLTLICEAPKIGPHRAAMRSRIAAILQLDERQVSVKATTSERLGFTGREEGIAAQAIATVRVPGG